MTTPPLIETIRDSIIGEGEALNSPYGLRRITYADYVASGRCLSFIENFIQEEVMRLYANTHTEASRTGLQTTLFREESREMIKEYVGGNEEDVLIFCGSGATGAINRLIQILNLRIPSDLDEKYGFSKQIPEAECPVVFIGPYEHHSNEISWRESIADVVVIPEDQDGQIDLEVLTAKLKEYEARPLKIGSFSAASNVTGILSNVDRISSILHEHGALSFWDYAAAAPYVPIDMNPKTEGQEKSLAYKDAIFISPHKFIGGPGTPGLLIVKKALLTNRVPAIPGGGTVAYVTPTIHKYLEDPAHREEGGTPAIIESIRAALVFQLKEAVGSEWIEEKEHDFIQRAIQYWKPHHNMRILGNPDAKRLSIVSFIVKYEDRYLHHNFVVALLNDLFGIQARGGCSCAGPYGHHLLGIDLETSEAFTCEIAKGTEGIKPGWVRINFNYFITENTFDFLLKAICFVAQEGWKFLPFYQFDLNTGLWKHIAQQQQNTTSLHHLHYSEGKLVFPSWHIREPESALQRYLDEAKAFVKQIPQQLPSTIPPSPQLSPKLEELRWFPLPDEIFSILS